MTIFCKRNYVLVEILNFKNLMDDKGENNNNVLEGKIK